MKQSTVIPWKYIEDLAKNAKTVDFDTWFRKQEAPVLIIPNRQEPITEEQYKWAETQVRHFVDHYGRRMSVTHESTVRIPDFEVDSKLEPVVRLLARLERELRMDHGNQSHTDSYREEELAVIRAVGFEKLCGYLEPYKIEGLANINDDILQVERQRYIVYLMLDSHLIASHF